jgi:CHAD domain-containing protein
MAMTKWFPRLTSAAKVRTAARAALEARIEAVRHYVALVADQPAEDPEHIHQLRVSTRRLAAALSLFRRQLKGRPRRRLRDVVRRIRRAAGAARDLDVLRDLLVSELAAIGRDDRASVELVTRGLDRERQAARREVARMAGRWSGPFAKTSAAILERLAKNDARDGRATRLGELARRVVPKRATQFSETGRGDLTDLDRLHQLRIAAKRLRYVMELVGYCFAARFRDSLYGEIERIQEELGAINDLRNLLALVPELPNAEFSKRDRSQHGTVINLDLLAARVSRELTRQHAAFVARWPARRQKIALHFERLLKRRRPRPVGRPTAP